jgi:hypothetical protein
MMAVGNRGGEGCGEGQAEIGPGPAVPAAPMRFSGEGASSPARHEAHQRGCQRALLAVLIAGGRPAHRRSHEGGPESG